MFFCLLMTLALLPFKPKAQIQDIVYVDTGFSIFVPKIIFNDISPLTCDTTIIQNNIGFQLAYDFMLLPSGFAYGYGIINSSQDTGFFVTSLNNPISNLMFSDQAITQDDKVEGMACDENAKAYAAGRGITRVNSACCNNFQETYIGDLPVGLECQGDITYRRGKFYMAAMGNRLVEVNMKDPGSSQVIMEFPPWVLPVHGLATVQVDCDSVATYALGRADDHSEVYLIDFDNLTVNLVCDIPVAAITGAGSITECALPPCALFVDLDNDNSSIAFWGNYCAEPFCQGPVAVADTDVVILSMANTLDSLELVLSDALDGSAEYLETNISNANLTVLGNGSGTIKFLNNGPATLADFEAALGSVFYQNTATAPTYGLRQVKVTGWSQGEESILSTADLPLSNDVLKTTATATLPNCHGSLDGSLLAQATAGTAPYTYQWQTGSTDSLLTGIAAGTYHVTVSDAGGCMERDSFTLGEPDLLLPAIEYNGLPAICDQSAVLTAQAVGGTPPYSFDWGNGATTASNTNLGPGDYPLTVTDANGCTATASYNIGTGQSVEVQQQATICEGQQMNWNGLTLDSDTTVCLTVTLHNGCDSTTCLTLTINPLPQPVIAVEGTLCNGGEVELTVGDGFESVFWLPGGVGPTIQVSGDGDYRVVVSNSFGCTASASVTVAPALFTNLIVTDPSCHGRLDGGISFGWANGGTPPYLYSINGTDFTQLTIFDHLPAGDYQATVKDALGCEINIDLILIEPPPLSINAGPDATILLGEAITIYAEASPSNLTVSWQPSDYLDCNLCDDPTASPPSTIDYTATISFGNGCEASDTVRITVEETGAYYIPNAFSPNQDGINDVFSVYGGRSMVKVVLMEVYDRKGGLAFSASDIPANRYDKGWTGKIGDELAQTGAYTYRFLLEFTSGKVETVTGTVTLVR